MQADEWERVKLVFEAAIALPENQRLPYVDSALVREPRLAGIVAELLRSHAGAGRFLESVPLKIRHVFAQNELVASRFRIVKLIGDGGMGEVYEAFDERLRVPVALKTLRHELMSDPQALERFRREILVAREVSHDCVCKVFDLVEHVDPHGAAVPCLTMKLIEGESLLKYLQTRRPVSPEDALPLIRQIASAIDALHTHGIVHRDLKPSNIMLTTRNGVLRAVVTDFGLAKPETHLEDGLFESKLEFEAGSPYFMAPELLRDGRPSPASDIYALGLIIDEMVTRSRAFPAESLHSLYYQKLWETPIPPSQRSNSLPSCWDTVVMRCLAAAPEDRYSRAAEAVSVLEQPNPVVPAIVPATVAKPTAQAAPALVRGRKISQSLLSRCLSLASSTGRRTRVALATVLLGAVTVVGIARSLTQPLRTSVVVFPIENLTNRADLGYLCKGIGAELMRRLTLIEGVQVIPYYEPRANIRLDQLKGRLALQGLLQISGDRVRLTAQLLENRDGSLLWAQNFERDMQNPLQLQSDIAEGSVQALQLRTQFGNSVGLTGAGLLPGPVLKLLGFQQVAVPRAATANSAAFDYYLRGRNLADERTVPAALDAIRNFESALREDPGFALAKAALSDTQFVLLDFEYEPLEVLMARARGFAEDAVRFDPGLAEAHTSLASVRQGEWDYAGAEESFKTAIRINPNFPKAHRWYAGLLMQFARYDEALAQMRRAIELDPYDYGAQANNGAFLLYARRTRDAVAQLEDTLTHKELILAHVNLGDAYLQLALESSGKEAQDNIARALQQADLVEAVVRRTMSQTPSATLARSVKYADRMHAAYYAASGRFDAAQPYAERLREDTDAGRISGYSLAMYYTFSGDEASALTVLERAVARKDRQIMFIKASPHFDRLRNKPRFEALLNTMGLS